MGFESLSSGLDLDAGSLSVKRGKISRKCYQRAKNVSKEKKMSAKYAKRWQKDEKCRSQMTAEIGHGSFRVPAPEGILNRCHAQNDEDQANWVVNELCKVVDKAQERKINALYKHFYHRCRS